MRIGLVLGAGGYTGTAFHAGLLTALARHAGVDARSVDLIVGTSAGSTAAALLRQGFPPQEYVARMTGAPLSAAAMAALAGMGALKGLPQQRERSRLPANAALAGRMALRPWQYPIGVWGSALLPEGSVTMGSTGGALPPEAFREWPELPTWLMAVNLENGERTAFGQALRPALSQAVAASCAIPGYFEPATIDGQRYVDGGAYSMLSLDLVAGLGLDVVIASAPMAMTSGCPGHARDMGRLVLRRQLNREARKVEESGTKVIKVAPDADLRALMGVGSMDVTKRPAVATASYDYVRTLLPRWPVLA